MIRAMHLIKDQCYNVYHSFIINDYNKGYMHVFYTHKYLNDVIIYTSLVSNINNNLYLV